MTKHTLAHALRPAETGCRCNKADIRTCVICGKWLAQGRPHVDTCGERCFASLCRKQVER
jgi:hypothetical protein